MERIIEKIAKFRELGMCAATYRHVFGHRDCFDQATTVGSEVQETRGRHNSSGRGWDGLLRDQREAFLGLVVRRRNGVSWSRDVRRSALVTRVSLRRTNSR